MADLGAIGRTHSDTVRMTYQALSPGARQHDGSVRFGRSERDAAGGRDGGPGLRQTGPAVLEVVLPVAAGASVVKAWVKCDAAYSNRPRLVVPGEESLGITAATATATASADWQELSVSITAAGPGGVRVQLVNRMQDATTINGPIPVAVAFWDDVSIA